MKIDIKHFALAAAGATMLLTSCIGDLDTLPLNPSDSTSETVYGKDENGYLAGLTKLYFNFVSNDTTDLQVSDGGASDLTAFRTDHGTFGGFISTVFTFHCCSLLLAANCHCP